MLRTIIAVLAVLSGAFLGSEISNAQTLTRDDAKVEQVLRERPGWAVLIVDVRMRDENGANLLCTRMTLSLAGEERRVVIVDTRVGGVFGGDNTDGGYVGLRPGLYLAAGINCEGAKVFFRGNFAKILIGPGDIVAAGTLVIDYKKGGSFFKPTYSGSVHIEGFNPKTLASLKERIPATLAKATKSPLLPLSELEKRYGLKSPKRS
jgi:hypothetical protein